MELEIKELSKALDTMQKDAVDRIKAINDTVEALQKGSATKDEIASFKDALSKNETDIQAVNKFAEELQKQWGQKELIKKSESFENALTDLVQKNAQTIQTADKKSALSFEIADFHAKDMSFGNNTTGTVVAPDFDRNIYGQPYQVPHLRSLVRVGSTSSNTYYYVVATLKPGNAGPAAGITPGMLKPEVQFQFDGKTAPVIKIAGHVRMPEEMVEDIDGMTSYINNYMPEEVLKVEDFEIIRGPGTTGHFNGLITQASTHVPSPGVDTTEMWDLIANGIAIQQNKWLPANMGLINPIDWFLMATRKSTDGIYSHPTLIAGAPLTVNGLRLMPHPIINQDEYLLGDFTRAEIKFKKGLTVRWYDQDQDNAVKNLVTVVAEERAAFAVYYPDAFLKGDFGNIS